MAPAASAAVVTYGLDLSVPGEFQIFASANTDDNFGLVAYGVPLTAETSAMITNFEHLSPAALAATDSNSQFDSAGFTLLRTTYTMPNGGMTFMASQDAINPTPHLIRGFGQKAGSFSDQGLTSLAPATQAAWGDALLIARGTYIGDVSNFHIDTLSVDLFANVFVGQAGIQNVQANVQVTGANGFNYTPLPPPVVDPPIDLPPIITPPVAPPPVIAPPNPVPPVIPNAVAPPISPPPVSLGPRPVVTYNLDLTVPGEFKVFASTSADDNFGLAFYAMPFTPETTGMITSIEQMSPAAQLASDANSVIGSAGFTALRADYTLPNGGLAICASQDIISGTPHLIRGLGQTAGSFSELGLTSLDASNNPAWDDMLLIAQGTYVGNANDFQVDINSVDLVANVLSAQTGGANVVADVHVFGTNGFSYVPALMPPPAFDPPSTENPIEEPGPPELPELAPSIPSDPPVSEDPAEGEPDSPLDEPSTGAPWRPIYYSGFTEIDWIEYPPFLFDSDILEPVTWVEYHPEFLSFIESTGLEIYEDGDSLFRTFSNNQLAVTNSGVSAWLSAYSYSESGGEDSGVPEPSSILLASLALVTLIAATRRRS